MPEKLAAHNYAIGHQNPTGLLQRDALSCRFKHRNSPVPHFAPGFDDDGMPVAREGYHVPCRKHSDCYKCGRHPLTGQHYVCQKRHVLYDTVYTTSKAEVSFHNLTGGSANAFDISMEDAAINGKAGVCVDLDSSMNEGCGNPIAAQIKDGLIG